MSASSTFASQPPSHFAERTKARSSPWVWAAFAVCSVCAIGLFFIPAFIIRPFRYQAPRALWLAMLLRQRAPTCTLIAAVACLLSAIALWRTSDRWRKSVLALTLLIVCFSAAMARTNYFEWMFHPVDAPQFVAQFASKLDSKEMILAVRFGGDARAYPISQMAYHHILNDVVDGVPVAVTY
jgi:bacteriorhodopsin